MAVKTHILGFPRIGENRQLKKAVESFWGNKCSETELLAAADKIKKQSWNKQKDLDFITIGDFSFYDHILDHSYLFGNIPARFKKLSTKSPLNIIFAAARGINNGEENIPASEMTKWFDTNYHYIIPEFKDKTQFSLNPGLYLSDIKKASSVSKNIKAVLTGPLTYLWLGKTESENSSRLKLLPSLLKCYINLFQLLKENNIEWIQVDEPVLILDTLPLAWIEAFRSVYRQFSAVKTDKRPKLLLASYFEGSFDNLNSISEIPSEGYHFDLCAGNFKNKKSLLKNCLKTLPDTAVISLGIINGRNIWKADLEQISVNLSSLIDTCSKNIWIGTSCSLLHVPYSTESEKSLPKNIKKKLSFALEKIQELTALKNLFHSEQKPVTKNPLKRLTFHFPDKIAYTRSPFNIRAEKQQALLNLPLLPTTTIGSFPQTKEIRKNRYLYKTGMISESEYIKQIKNEVKLIIKAQENMGLDVLVHGEPERNDMVEYFTDLLEGFIQTDFGWVQSYGSRCVKPAIVLSDIKWVKPLSVPWAVYAQSLTNKPVKGMLSGPVTMIKWSFTREDISFEEQVHQTALALAQEVKSLEQEGIKIIQIDEAAFKEAQPLSVKKQPQYNKFASNAFRICTSDLNDETQVHTHMCYSDFTSIMDAVKNMDADVLTIETSRSEMELLKVFKNQKDFNQFGPGIYDIHSSLVPGVHTLRKRIRTALQYISSNKLWINPDCGLKTRNWEEIEPALQNLCLAASLERKALKDEAQK